MKRITLYCFPFAGGSASAYNKWRQYADRHIELKAVELAGRGRRIYEPVYNHMKDAVDDVFNMISPDLAVDISHGGYAFYGHSMGGIIAYELARVIREKQLPGPRHIFFSGRTAPHVPFSEDEESYYDLPDEEFKEKIIDLGGTPKEFFEHPELLHVLLPMLRSDFRIAETYEHKGNVEPFDHDITVLFGKDEDVAAEECHGWKEHTRKVCRMHFFEGDHFFIHRHAEKIMGMVNYTLLNR